MKKFKNYLKRILKLINLEEMRILPGHLAFNLVLMIVPIFSLIGVIGSNLKIEEFVNSLSGNIPDAVLTIVKSSLNTQGTSYSILFIIFTLWLISGSCRAIIASSDLLFKIKDTSNLKMYIKSFFMVIILFALVIFILTVPVLGDSIFNFLNNHFSKKGIEVVAEIYHFLKYPLSIIFIYIFVKLLYSLSLNIKIPSKYMNNGAWFTTISWFLASRIYSYHLNNYSNYNIYYGSLSNILILLVWVYLLAFLFAIGMVLNADNYHVSKKEEKI